MSVTQLKLAVSNPICTHQQLAELDFQPCPEFVKFDTNPDAMEEHEDKLRSLGWMSRFALATLGKTKPEVIEMVRKMDEDKDIESSSVKFLWYMTGAREDIEALLAMITSAEIRMACAIANVYEDNEEKLPPIPKPPVDSKGLLSGKGRRR
jgi:hypothetical protein